MRKVKTRKSIKNDEIEDVIYQKAKNSAFKQQRLPAWRPVPTLSVIIAIYIIFGLIFIAIGIILLHFSNQIITISKRYDNLGVEVNLTMTIPENMEKPIMVYYQLEGFYQNHRRYLKSQSRDQLYGEDISLKKMKEDGDCDPIYTNSDLDLDTLEKDLDPNDIAIPCGLMAKTYFTDTFSNWTVNGTSLDVNDKDIAWEKDVELFKNSANSSKQWLNMTDPHFLVWMRASGLPDFKKLWGRIEKRDLKKGEVLSVLINNNYDVEYYEGKKNLVLSTTNVFGGKNAFLAIGFIIVGGISLLLSIVFPVTNWYLEKRETEFNKIN